MTQLWRLAWQEAAQPRTEDHDTEHDALLRADELARAGRLAFVYPVQEEIG